MKYLSIFFLFLSSSLAAQTDTFFVKKNTDTAIIEAAPATEELIYTFVEQMPEFPGGNDSLEKFISIRKGYPQMERDNNIEGKVYVRFIVNEDGTVSNPNLVRKVSPGLDKEAIRVVKLLPPFKPGRQRGKPVKVYYILPISFNLSK